MRHFATSCDILSYSQSHCGPSARMIAAHTNMYLLIIVYIISKVNARKTILDDVSPSSNSVRSEAQFNCAATEPSWPFVSRNLVRTKKPCSETDSTVRSKEFLTFDCYIQRYTEKVGSQEKRKDSGRKVRDNHSAVQVPIPTRVRATMVVIMEGNRLQAVQCFGRIGRSIQPLSWVPKSMRHYICPKWIKSLPPTTSS